MEEIQELTEELKTWSYQQKVEERSIQCFFEILENMKKGDAEEFTSYFPDFVRERFTVKVTEIYLILRRFPESKLTPYIVACIPIIYYQIKYGVYSVVFDLSGEICDDFWEFDQ